MKKLVRFPLAVLVTGALAFSGGGFSGSAAAVSTQTRDCYNPPVAANAKIKSGYISLAPGQKVAKSYRGPGSNCGVYNGLDNLVNGMGVSVVAVKGAWTQLVFCCDASTYWVPSDMVKLGSPKNASYWVMPYDAKSDSPDSYANVRKGPGTQYAVSKKLYYGNLVAVVESNGQWRKLKDGGWIHTNQLCSYTFNGNAFCNL